MRDFEMQRNGSPFAIGSPKQGEEVKSDRESSANPESIIKHPLENSWTLWYFKNDRNRQWEENQREVMSFNTVEDFWSMYNHIEYVSKLATGCDYSFFKTGIKPMWEDEANNKGGKWLISLDRVQRNSGTIDNIWLEILLCLIGENFEESGNMVNGAVVSIRPKQDKICLWLRECGPYDVVAKIGQKLKDALHFDPQQKIGFEEHTDNRNRNSSVVKSKYSI